MSIFDDNFASFLSVKKSYRLLSLQIHPDKASVSKKALATEKFKLLQKIFEVLSDDFKKNIYDEKGIVLDFQNGIRAFTISDAQMNECITKYAGMMNHLLIFKSLIFYSIELNVSADDIISLSRGSLRII